MRITSMAGRIHITKANGVQELYNGKKLLRSLIRSGATNSTAKKIESELHRHLFNGITTREIYAMAFRLLRIQIPLAASHYNLKRGIIAMGPDGFAFEQLAASIIAANGYRVKTGVHFNGKCIRHEVDVVGEKENELVLTECKFRNEPGIFCDVSVPLYINSRFLDITGEWIKNGLHKGKAVKAWIVTNAKFSEDAIRYATCESFKLTGWNFPENASLQSQIDKHRLFPLTCLLTLNKKEKSQFLAQKIVLCTQLNPGLLKKAGVNDKRSTHILREIEKLCTDERG